MDINLNSTIQAFPLNIFDDVINKLGMNPIILVAISLIG